VTSEHFFTEEPTSELRPRQLTFTFASRTYELVSAAGVFSANRLDLGTQVLLKKSPLPDHTTTGALLDLGCGYGPIACVLAVQAPQATIYAVDVNARARSLTSENVASVGGAERVVVAAPDEVPADVQFEQIWSNPPIHAGKAELHEMLLRWLPRLAPDGAAYLVVAKHLGGDSLQQWLIEQGFPTERQASQKGFRVLRVTRAR